MEALLKIADIRASKAPVADALLQDNTGRYDPARSNQSVASSATGGEGAPQVASDPAESGDEYEVRVRTGRPEAATGGTRQPATATRFINTTLGRLSYAALADHLAERVAAVEVERGSCPFEPIHEELIVSLRHAICADLVPDYVGWRNGVDVMVGTHSPPQFFVVPQLNVRGQHVARIVAGPTMAAGAFSELHSGDAMDPVAGVHNGDGRLH